MTIRRQRRCICNSINNNYFYHDRSIMKPISLKGLHAGATMSQKAREIGSRSLVKVGEWCTQNLSYLGRSVRPTFISSVATNFRADDIKNNILLNQYLMKKPSWRVVCSWKMRLASA